MKAKKQTSTQTTQPWGPSQPFLQDIMSQAQKNYGSGQGIQAYSGPRVAAESANTQLARSGIRERALNGNPLLDQAQSSVQGLLAGTDNGALVDNVAATVLPRVAASFGGMGRTGSGLHQDTATRAFTQAYAPFAQADQDRMLRAASMAPALAQADYTDLNMLNRIGAQESQYNQGLIDEDMARYYENQNAPYEALKRYNSIVQGHAGLGGTTTSRKPGRSPFQTMLGAGLGIAGLLM